MNKNTKNLIAFVISYFITRLGFYLLGYNPFEHNSFWIGLAIDFGIWVVVFIGASTLLTKLFKSRS